MRESKEVLKVNFSEDVIEDFIVPLKISHPELNLILIEYFNDLYRYKKLMSSEKDQRDLDEMEKLNLRLKKSIDDINLYFDKYRKLI